APENTETSSESSGENTILNTPSASRIDSADVLIEAEDEEYHDEEQKNMVAQFAEGGSLESTRGPSFIVEETASSIDTKAGVCSYVNEDCIISQAFSRKTRAGKKSKKGVKKGGKKSGKKTGKKSGKSKRSSGSAKSLKAKAPPPDMLSPAAMENLYYIAHDAPDALQKRGFSLREDILDTPVKFTENGQSSSGLRMMTEAISKTAVKWTSPTWKHGKKLIFQ
ncbi:Small lysine-rich protein 1, partial [Biomphalaria glabrata]